MDIGIPDAALAAIAPVTAVDAPGLWRATLGGRRVSDHKYRRGHVVVRRLPWQR